MITFGVARKHSKNLIPYFKTLNENNIKLYEMGFAFSIPEKIDEESFNFAKKSKIKLTGHLPFYINFGNPKRIEQSKEYLKKGIKIANFMESTSVFHLGFYFKRSFNEIKKDIINSIKEIFEPGQKGFLGIETTGKNKAIGTYDEVMELAKELRDYNVIPIIDFAHIYARHNGAFPKTCEHFSKILDDLEKLNIKNHYFHCGGIEYSNFNEKRHTSIKSCEPPLAFLIKEIELRNMNAQIIIESKTSIEDIKWLRENKKEFLDYTKDALKKKPIQNSIKDFFTKH